MSTSRCRAPNFTREEQERLFEIVQKFSSIIECKKTDNIKQSQKQATWAKIQQIYNSGTKAVPRSIENLINCYRNMKSKVKKQHSDAKMNLKDLSEQKKLINAIEENGENWEAVSQTINQTPEYCEVGFEILKKELKKEETDFKKLILGTGGGPPPDDNIENSHLKKLKKMIQPQVDGMYTKYDGDSELMAEFQLSLPIEERSEPVEMLKECVNEAVIEVPCIKETPPINRQDILKKKKDIALDISRPAKKDEKSKKTCNDSFQALADAKLELVCLQREALLLEIEHKRKIYDIEVEERRKESEFNDKMREKKLLLLDLDVKKNM